MSKKDERLEDLKRQCASLEVALKNEKDPSSILEKIELSLEWASEGKLGGDVYTSFVMNDMLPKLVIAVLKRGDLDDELVPRVNEFLQEVIRIVLQFAEHDFAEMIEGTLFKIFFENNPFYAEHNTTDITEEDEEVTVKSDKVIVQASTNASRLLIANLRYFAERNGFEIYLNRIKNSEDKAPLVVVKNILKSFNRVRQHLAADFMNNFVPELQTAVFSLILNLTDEEFKNEEKKVVTEILFYVEQLLKTVTPKANEIVEKFNLQVILKCLYSPYLEKRVTGVTDIRDIINNIWRKPEIMRRHQQGEKLETSQWQALLQWMPEKYLADWITDNQILEYILTKGMHIELVKRCGDLVKFLAANEQLDKKVLDLLWDASQGKHESVTHQIYGVIGDISMSLHIPELDYLFEKIRAIPYASYDLQTLTLIRTFTINGINTNSNAKKKKWYGLEVFWELMQDETVTHPDVAQHAQACLYELLQWTSCHQQRLTYLELCMQNLQQHQSVPQSLNILSKIISTYPPKKTKKDTDDIPFVVDWLEETHHLRALFFKELLHYKALAKAALLNVPLEERSRAAHIVLVGKQPHLAQIKERMDFLDYVTKHSNLMLTIEQLDTFWECEVQQALVPEERNLAFNWLENARAAHSQQHGHCPLDDETTQYLFEKKVPELDFSSLSSAGFSFFEYYFRYINWKNNKFEQDQTSAYALLSFDLLGMEYLWKIALQARDPTVGTQAITLITNLQRSLSPELQPFVGQNRERFVRTCMQHLSLAAKNFNNADSQLTVERCLTLLKAFLHEFETKLGVTTQKHGSGVPTRGTPITVKMQLLSGAPFELEMFSNDTIATLKQKTAEKLQTTVNSVRLITSGKELKDDMPDGPTLKANRVVNNTVIHIVKRHPPQDAASAAPKPAPMEQDKDESILPSTIISKQEYFDELFKLLNLEPVAQQAWDLMMLLPTNSKMLNDISALQQATTQPAWSSLLDTSSTFKLYYSLQIVETLLQVSEEEPEAARNNKALWRQQFLSLGGLKHLYSILTTNNFLDKSKGSKRKVCLALLLKLINFFIIVPATDKNSPPQLNADLSLFNSFDMKVLVPKLMELILFCASDSNESPDPANSAVVLQAMPLLTAACISQPDTIMQHQSIEDWIAFCLLNTADKQIREYVSSGLYNICKFATGFVAPRSIVTKHLLSFLSKIEVNLLTSEEYFELLAKLVGEHCDGVWGGRASDFTALLDQLITMIKSHPIVEARNTKYEDVVLIGLFNLTRTLVSKDASFRATAGALIQELFFKCLFEIPTADNHGPYAPPKCKTQRSRKMAFKLLTELARDCAANFRELSNLLLRHHSEDKRTNWHYIPSAYQKSSTGYVGLRNQGATCYMNSLMQQLFMVPPLRYGLLSVSLEERIAASLATLDTAEQETKKKELLSDNVLYQMQMLLANLQESEKKFFDTKDFCKSYKYDGQPINPLVQMDADEFFNMLFDRLENLLKGTPQEQVLKEFFGGTICNQVISKECSHVSEREEGFYTLSLEVKNKKNINESLDLYVVGDPLEGENKYYCSQCDKKVDALRRSCINSLPDNLIIHLKRFEFDLEQFRRVKVNDYCEFPTLLNLEQYTKEGLARKEGRILEDDPKRPAYYYEYELTGILVHTGTADSGHYYSFIRRREPFEEKERKWYQFNDTDVEPFDPQDIPKNCYGGFESVMQWDSQQQKQVPRYMSKIYSAYMLFYERVKPIKKESAQFLSPVQESKIVPSSIFNAIWQDNMTFLVDKNIFDPDYYSFLWSIVSLVPIPTAPVAYDTPPDFDPMLQAIELGTRFVFATLSHAKEKPNFRDYVTYLKQLYSKHIVACKWLLETVCKDTTWLRQILFQCPTQETREPLAGLFIHVINTLVPLERSLYTMEEPFPEEMEIDTKNTKKKLKQTENPLVVKRTGMPKALVLRFMDTLLSMLKDANPHWHNYAHYFLLFKEFASLGVAERAFLISRQVIAQFIDFYMCDESPYASHFKSKRPKMGDKHQSPLLGHLIECLAVLVRSSDVNPTAPTQTNGEVIPISDIDKELLQWKPFYERSISENIQPKATSDIAVHLCWENEELSKAIILACTEGIDRVTHDLFPPYFMVLTPMLAVKDSLQESRVSFGMKAYLRVVAKNAQYKNVTFCSIKYLVDILPGNKVVADYLFEHKDWIEPYLMGTYLETVRDVTAELVLALIPYPSLFGEDNQPRVNLKELQITPEAQSRMHSMYKHLLQLLVPAAQYWKFPLPESAKSTADCEAGVWRLTQYFKLLQWLTRSQAEKEIFNEYFTEFSYLLGVGEPLHLACDENKRELMNYWRMCCVDYPNNVKLITTNDKIIRQLFDFFISISPSPKYVAYNQQAMPAYYSILLLCCENDPKFLQAWSSQGNFEWAIRYLYLETSEYGSVANIIYDTVKLAIESKEIRLKCITLALQMDKLQHNSFNVLRLLDLTLRQPSDAIIFCKYSGLNQLQQFIEQKVDREENDKLVMLLELAFSVIYKGFQWLADDTLKQAAKTVIQKWDQKPSLVAATFSMLKRFPHKRLFERAEKVLVVLSTIDIACLANSLHSMLQFIQGSPESMDVDSKEKPEAFYALSYTLCDLSFKHSDVTLLSMAVDTAVATTKDVLKNPTISSAFFSILEKFWDAANTVVLENNNFQQLVVHMLLVDNQQLFNVKCEDFVKKVLPKMKDTMTSDVTQKVLSSQSKYIQSSVDIITQSLKDQDLPLLETAVHNLSAVLKSIQLFGSMSSKEFAASNKEALLTALKICTSEPGLPKREELESMLKQLVV